MLMKILSKENSTRSGPWLLLVLWMTNEIINKPKPDSQLQYFFFFCSLNQCASGKHQTRSQTKGLPSPYNPPPAYSTTVFCRRLSGTQDRSALELVVLGRWHWVGGWSNVTVRAPLIEAVLWSAIWTWNIHIPPQTQQTFLSHHGQTYNL